MSPKLIVSESCKAYNLPTGCNNSSVIGGRIWWLDREPAMPIWYLLLAFANKLDHQNGDGKLAYLQ